MTPATLQALRRLLFFSVEEAALLVAASPERPQGVSPRSWQYWERGERPVPADVTETIQRLCAWRAQAIATADAAVASMRARHGAPADVVLVWYQTIDDWASLAGREPLQWRPQCSVVAELAARHGARLVAFDGPAYAAWLGRRMDSETMRSEWAARLA
jgi:hypothetical protein